MASEASLGSIWDNHATASACLAIAKRAHTRPAAAWFSGSGAARVPSADEIERSTEELGRLFVVALWATFERNVIEYVQAGAVAVSDAHPQRFVATLNQKLKREIEWWRFDDILDLLKSFVNANLIGEVRQIKGFRDWVVHRNPRTSPPRTVTPDYAFRTLSSVLRRIEDAM